MSTQSSKPVSLIVTAALVGGLGLSASAFAMNDLGQGYLLGAHQATQAAEKAVDAKATDAKHAEGKCGEGKCGMQKMDTDKDGRISQAEFGTAHQGDTSKFAAHDPNKDGFISAEEMKAHHEGKCGGDKKTGDKAHMEGKCGEGKCGGMA